MNATITRRIDPCTCGCQGADSWHAREFMRVLSDVQPASGLVQVQAYREPVEVSRQATARLPWGEGRPVRVVEVVSHGHVIGWFSTSEVL